MSVHVVDLTRPPRERWRLDELQCAQARELVHAYRTDLGLAAHDAGPIAAAGAAACSADHGAELAGLAALLGLPVADVALTNLYYDALKLVLGCSAFAVETDDGILHARNLDWWTSAGMLARYTMVTRFVGAPAGEFVTVGWPGFAGVLSAMAPGRFAVTLNSVLSFDPPQLAMPVVFRLRSVLEHARSFEEALATLAEVPIPCDCLLLLTGTRRDELAVVERTPSRAAVRRGSEGRIVVTNDYLLLAADEREPSSPIGATSCDRFDRVTELLQQSHPRDLQECLHVLRDPGVRMDLTVQQMVFHAATGRLVAPS